MRAMTTLQEWVRANAAELREWPPISTGADPGCMVADCERSTFAINLCRAHYKRASRAFRSERRRSS